VVAPAFGTFSPWSAGGFLTGAANLTAAQGQYWNDIQSARMAREQANQMAIDTRRKQLQAQLEFEKLRPTAASLMRTQRETDLEWARNFAQDTELWSGRALNVLLDSIIRSGRYNQGPYIPLADDVLRGLNLTDGTSRANSGLFKGDGKLFWPEALDNQAND